MITTFFNEPKLKEAVIRQLREHKRLDQITQQIYWEDGRGCHLGCLTHINSSCGDPHKATERLFGIPLRVTYWLEAVFEGLSIGQAKKWVIESTEAIPCGGDLKLAHHHFAVWLLDPATGINKITNINRDAIALVQALHIRAVGGESISDREWSGARSAAWSAAESAVWAAWSAAESAVWAAWSRARSAAWKKIAAKSIEIFQNSPIAECELCSDFISESFAHMNQPVLLESSRR